jgi:hypothetical protein
MNIIDEITESYTYNGVVSLKALEDDIITLENQIESQEDTLREIRLRGRNERPLLAKIRDSKIKLSFLKTIYKRESEKAVKDQPIDGVLGESAKAAKDIDNPGTAASGKEPVPQDFVSAEAGDILDGATSTSIITMEPEETGAESATPEVELTAKPEGESVTLDKYRTGENEYDLTSAPDDELPGIYDLLKREDDVFVTNARPVPRDPEKTSDVAVAPREDKPVYSNPLNADLEPVTDGEDMQAEPAVPDPVFTDEGAWYALNRDDKPEPVFEKAVVTDPHPEAQDGPKPVVEKGEEIDSDYPVTVIPDAGPGTDRTQSAIETENAGQQNDFPVYHAFQDKMRTIKMFIDLSVPGRFTGPLYVCGRIDPVKRLLDVRFVDVEDYDIFLSLLKEWEDNRRKIFGKKRRTIFMDIHTQAGKKERYHRFTFEGCGIVGFDDTMYATESVMDEGYVPTDTLTSHHCGITFKYKKLTIK